MNFGSDESSVTREAAIQKLRNAGKILVASAGNDGDTGYSYPASSDGVISVGATTINNEIADFSNRNSKVDICAPGKSVCTTTADGEYRYVSGTSFSSPIVAGAVAVIKCAGTGLSPEQIEEILLTTAKDLGASGRDNSYGYGLLQLDQAVAKARATEIIEPLEIDSFTVSLQSPQPVGTEMRLVARPNNVSGLHYNCIFSVTLNGETTILSDEKYLYTEGARRTWKPEQPGDYILTVYAKETYWDNETQSYIENETEQEILSHCLQPGQEEVENININLLRL